MHLKMATRLFSGSIAVASPASVSILELKSVSYSQSMTSPPPQKDLVVKSSAEQWNRREAPKLAVANIVKVVLEMEPVAYALVQKIVAKMSKLIVGVPEDNCDITTVVSESFAIVVEDKSANVIEVGAGLISSTNFVSDDKDSDFPFRSLFTC